VYSVSIRLVFILVAALSTAANSQNSNTNPLLATQAVALQEKRCMVCHGCYDAPCQLKLEANAGLQRGASKALVYDGSRLVESEMTRLFDDGLNESQWRAKGFYPVLDKDHPEQGVMYQMLELKKNHPLPARGKVPKTFDFALNRDQQCPKQDDFKKFATQYPLWGMPYGLPGLTAKEHQLMTEWLRVGAPEPEPQPLSAVVAAQLEKWETFLNGTSNKEKLMSRYLYEHLFLAGLYIGDEENPKWFRMVRSHNPPKRNIGLITTRRPFDDPRTQEFYYRLQRMPTAILDKRHMPYRFDQARMDWYQQLFLQPDYVVPTLPDYSLAMTDNPFVRFQALPASSRYRFLLEEAQFSIMNFIKGPVCRGQIALSVIDDHFWVMFANPDAQEPDQNANFLAKEANNLRLPTVSTGTPIDLLSWRRYSKAERKYAKAKSQYLKTRLDSAGRNLDMDDIWDGEGRNNNATLTVFRHFDTASVVKGMVGDVPKTAWVINYPLLERIHYLLVAGFDVYGGATHQLESRLYMDFLRMEGEYNFLMFLPPEDRIALRDYWYREANPSVREHYFGTSDVFKRDTDVVYKTDDPKKEFLLRMREHIHGAKAQPYDYRETASPKMVAAFEKLEANVGRHNSFLPQVNFVNVIGPNRNEAYTIIRNSAYSNIAQLFKEEKRRLPNEDSLTVVRGLVGAYPNNFIQVNEHDLPNFVKHIAGIKTRADADRVSSLYSVRRNAPWFWNLSDRFHTMHKEKNGITAGIFDYNRYQSY
jgi:hypothetical protein